MAELTPSPDDDPTQTAKIPGEGVEATRVSGENAPTEGPPDGGENRNPVSDSEGPTTIQDVPAIQDDLLTMLPLGPPQRQGSLGRIDHYEVLNAVGQGGMGVVVRAFDDELHRNVAVKFMSKQMIASDSARKRFIREARSAAGINHPNVVTIHAVAEHEGVPFLVMEYVDGHTLLQRIEADAPMSTARGESEC